MRTMRKINKPIKFFGLSSGQFAVFMLVVALIIIFSIFKQLHPVFIIGIVSGILGLSGMLFGTLKKEHKAGNPDYNWSCKSRSRSSPCFPKNTARASPFIASPLFSPTSILLLNILSVAYLNMNIVFSIRPIS